MSTVHDDRTLRCAEWARQLETDPIGTAGHYRGYLLLPWPMPWPRDFADIPELAPVVAAAARDKVRLQGLVPLAERDRSPRVVLYRAPPGEGFRSFVRQEASVSGNDLVATALGLLDTHPEADQGGTEPVKDVLVCGHGRRDRCCGSLGVRMALDLVSQSAAWGPGVRIWRTSHTGGHRFAPTMTVLPEGTVWAFVDADMVSRVLRREGPVSELLGRYRGCAGLGSPPLQALERAVLAEVGWPLLSMTRRGSGPDGDTVRLGVEQEGQWRTWAARVTTTRSVPLPPCGAPLSDASGHQPEFAVHFQEASAD